MHAMVMERVLSITDSARAINICYRYSVLSIDCRVCACRYVDDDRKCVIDKSQYTIYRLLLSETVVHVLSITVIDNCSIGTTM